MFLYHFRLTFLPNLCIICFFRPKHHSQASIFMLRTHYWGKEREEKKQNVRRDPNPRPQELCSAVLQLLPFLTLILNHFSIRSKVLFEKKLLLVDLFSVQSVSRTSKEAAPDEPNSGPKKLVSGPSETVDDFLDRLNRARPVFDLLHGPDPAAAASLGRNEPTFQIELSKGVASFFGWKELCWGRLEKSPCKESPHKKSNNEISPNRKSPKLKKSKVKKTLRTFRLSDFSC